MVRARLVVGVVLAALVVVAWSDGQEPKPKGQLPAGWKQLGLTKEQTEQVYKVQTEYRTKIAQLESEIEKLKKEQKGALVKLLTDAQKARLRELSTADAATEDKKPDVKKPEIKKPETAKPATTKDKQ